MQLNLQTDYALRVLMALDAGDRQSSVDQIAVGDVVRRFENLDSFVGCLPGGGGCAVNGLCGLKPALSGALEAFLARLDGYRLSDLVPDSSAFLKRLEQAAVAA